LTSPSHDYTRTLLSSGHAQAVVQA